MTAPASSSNVNIPNPAANSANSNSIHANVIPSEVGWQFVPQYYTFVNKQPHRLHCFYTKNSTFIHGTEGEDGRPCYGQQEIHNKILSIGFQDCKVFIHSVDAQSSANGGIIIQVIGEMSNRGEPWRKFAQTFFLAEQPNGYFVLNDIFRFLKEESVEEEGDGVTVASEPEVAAPAPTSEVAAQVAQENAEMPAAPAVQAGHPIVAAAPYDAALPDHLQPSHGPAPPAPQPAKIVTPEPVPEQVVPVVPAEEKKAPAQPNGIHAPAAPEPEPAPVPQAEPAKQPASPAPPPASVVEPARPATPPPAPMAAPQPVASPAPAPPPAAAKPAATPSPKPVQPAVPAQPPAPKTWANLAAANSNKWGPQVAQEARGVSAAPPPAPAPAPAPKPEVQRASGGEKEARDGGRELHPLHQAALAVATPQCFVKSVTEVISHAALSSTLATRFGPIKELEIVRSKACAFLEFSTLDAARRAIVASLSVPAGGEGGVRVELEGGGSARISVETRKERADRPPPRPRTGPPTGQERGGFRGGAGRGRGAGRGAGAGTGTGAGTGPGTATKP